MAATIASVETEQIKQEIAVEEKQSATAAETAPVDREFTEEIVAPLPNINSSKTAPLPIVGKAFDLKRASVSSVDSDISLSYDAAPFYPRSLSQTGGMSSANNSSGSGTDDGGRHHSVASVASAAGINNTDSSDSAYEGGGQNKSGDESTPFVAPDEETTKRILDQVEFYFSDANIVKDAFLLKHVRRNKEGYVSLKLISSFKRVKHLAKDWRAVAHAIALSEKLEVNESGTKLRRKEPLPAYDQTTPSRTVVAINLAEEKPVTIETVAELFRGCGEIALIRVLRPGNPIPSDVRHFVNKHPEMGSNVSALIEFVRTESAHNAMSKDWSSEKAKDGQSMCVLELNAPASKKKATAAAKKSPMNRLFDSEYSSSCQSGSEAEDRQKMRMQRKVSANTLMRSDSSWNQRRWSRDSGTDSSASGYSRRDSYVLPPQHHVQQSGDYGHNRRMSSGWDSSSDSYYSGRSRSSSGVSIPETFGMRRFSLANNRGPEQHQQQQQQQPCCCCGHNQPPPPQQQQPVAMRRHSTQDNGHHYDMRRCSSSSSNSGGEMMMRKDSTSDFCCGSQPRDGFHNWSRKSSSSSMGEGGMGRRLSVDSDSSGGRGRRPSLGLVTPENVVRMPKGPDGCGSRGFQREPMMDSTLYE